KDVENRTWWLHMPPSLNYPAEPRRIYVHASRILDRTAFDWISKNIPKEITQSMLNHNMPVPCMYFRGYIIGEVDIIACISKTGNYLDDIPAMKSPWFTGPYGLVLKNAVLYDKPIPFKGHQRFFKVEGLAERIP
ncbi:hypothetical protein MUP77_17525, partial [Candidatus Bathyarchaeota archaeon]|nr:hypothetical protein [Candidatus Bathyarchaeota archaeon]